MIPIFKSRYTPNIENGENVKFNIGEVVTYKMRSGKVLDITIDSDYMQHDCGLYGYEAIFSDDGGRYFAAAEGIVNWEGKVLSK